MENYKTLKTQISGSTYYVHGWEELTSLKFPYYPLRAIYRLNCDFKSICWASVSPYLVNSYRVSDASNL